MSPEQLSLDFDRKPNTRVTDILVPRKLAAINEALIQFVATYHDLSQVFADPAMSGRNAHVMRYHKHERRFGPTQERQTASEWLTDYMQPFVKWVAENPEMPIKPDGALSPKVLQTFVDTMRPKLINSDKSRSRIKQGEQWRDKGIYDFLRDEVDSMASPGYRSAEERLGERPAVSHSEREAWREKAKETIARMQTADENLCHHIQTAVQANTRRAANDF